MIKVIIMVMLCAILAINALAEDKIIEVRDLYTGIANDGKYQTYQFIELRGHTYIVFKNNGNLFVLHDPDCLKEKKNKQGATND